MPKVSEIFNTPPIIEIFEIRGLNGFKDLRLTTPNCVRVVVAENGTGKTTLLNALYAILTKRTSKLHAIDFESITIKFRKLEPFTFTKEELFPKDLKPGSTSAFSELLSYGVSEPELLEFYSEIGPEFTTRTVRAHDVFHRVYHEGPYDGPETVRLLRRAMPSADRTTMSKGLLSYVTKGMDGYEVLYLPTFRRIEAEFSQFEKRSRRNHELFPFEPNQQDDNEDTLIWFGMGDVEAQLNLIKGRIRTETFEAYSRLSVQSLEDLLSPVSKSPEPITADNEILGSQLRLVLARLGQADGTSGNKIWDLIDSGAINEQSYDGLRSYLFQMLEIYTTTERDEQSIEGFVKIINNYWSTSAFESDSEIEKKFIFDKMSLSIDIRTPYSPNPLQLGNLSSGEKQIVSVFAKLHLQKDKNFIVLIDEPELSLSMAWQKLFLPDILESPSCMQLIAITHSPFIFENKLDQFAAPLFVKYKRG
ncbi:AAA family ATPase [Pseudomonas indica]|uniref:AAA family ATPase n=1 Tax=Pseudomonas indica TaxID=137658 RepID=UPI003FCF3583